MGDHHNNANAIRMAELAARRMPAHQPGERLLSAQLGWDYAPKPHVIVLKRAEIRRDDAGKVTQIFGRSRRRNAETGEEAVDAEPSWQDPPEGAHVHEEGQPLGQEFMDIVFMPISICVNPKMVNGITGEPLRQSMIPLNIAIARVDAKELFAAHEKNLMGSLGEMPR